MYDPDFYAEYQSDSYQSASAVLRKVFSWARPASVVDVGCGVGTWLQACRDLGVQDLSGIDGHWVSEASLLLQPGEFQSCDLERPLNLGRSYDLAISVEVAEHLNADLASTFVRSLTGLSDVVLFSAAIPLQGGTHHVNEQWPDYWADLFAANGYQCFDALRSVLWDDATVAYFYRQNVMIFVSETSYSAFSEALRPHLTHSLTARPMRLVHPDKYFELATFSNVNNRLLLRSLPRIALDVGRRRLKIKSLPRRNA